VIFLRYRWLFEETLAYRETLIATLALKDVRSSSLDDETLSRRTRPRAVVQRSRRLLPHPQGRALARALKPFAGWINGRKTLSECHTRGRYPGRSRTTVSGEIQPFAMCAEEIERSTRSAGCRRITCPQSGYQSVGCMALQQPDCPRRDARDGRWRGRRRRNCGIHTVKMSLEHDRKV